MGERKKRQRYVTVRIPADLAGVVLGALRFAHDAALGWPGAMAEQGDIRLKMEFAGVLSDLDRAIAAEKSKEAEANHG